MVGTLTGLLAFGVVFALNSALHSYLILAFSTADRVTMDVGFYYMSNAAGRLLGTALAFSNGLTTNVVSQSRTSRNSLRRVRSAVRSRSGSPVSSAAMRSIRISK